MTATIDYRGHVLHGATVVVRQRRDDLTVNGRPLGPMVHVDVVRGRVTGGFWLPPEAVRDVAGVVTPHPLPSPARGEGEGSGAAARRKRLVAA